jgi:hypothetical protein
LFRFRQSARRTQPCSREILREVASNAIGPGCPHADTWGIRRTLWIGYAYISSVVVVRGVWVGIACHNRCRTVEVG